MLIQLTVLIFPGFTYERISRFLSFWLSKLFYTHSAYPLFFNSCCCSTLIIVVFKISFDRVIYLCTTLYMLTIFCMYYVDNDSLYTRAIWRQSAVKSRFTLTAIDFLNWPWSKITKNVFVQKAKFRSSY